MGSAGEAVPGGGGSTLLGVLVRERRWGRYETFSAQLGRAARELAEKEQEPSLARVTVSQRTFRRWLCGRVATMPLPDASRVLEHMFGFPVRDLLSPVEAGAGPGDDGEDTGSLSAAVRPLMAEQGVSLRGLARLLKYDPSSLSKVIAGGKPCPPRLAELIDEALDADGAVEHAAAADRDQRAADKATREPRYVMVQLTGMDGQIVPVAVNRRAFASGAIAVAGDSSEVSEQPEMRSWGDAAPAGVAGTGLVALSAGPVAVPGGFDDEIAALELARRAEASDVGTGVLDGLELAVDDLATAYPGTAPGDLLVRVRSHLGYVGQLMDARATLGQRRRLMVTGGWLSLLAATCLIDLHKDGSAAVHLRTAERLADETGQAEIAAWCRETQAWQLLTGADYRRAAEMAQAAQHVAPRDGSAFIQATAQEGRAWARLGAAAEARAVLARVERLVAPLAVPDRPEHHYRYDPAKSEAYTATTLSWLGDPAAETYARQVLARLESSSDGPPRPRRAASARLDLSLALIAAGRHDEAADVALHAVLSGRLVPSNYWRAREVIHAVAERDVPEARELSEAYRELCTGRESQTSV